MGHCSLIWDITVLYGIELSQMGQTYLQWDRAYGKEQSHVGKTNLMWVIAVLGQRGLLWDIKDSCGTEQSHLGLAD